MSPTRNLLAALLAGTALAVAGCGDPEEGEPIREGLAHELDGLDYNVFITRQLNLSLPEDKAYYDGPAAPAGSALYGVFIEVCNRGEEPHEAVDHFTVTDTQGAEFEPVELPEENDFAYRPAVLQPDQCIPARGSVPQLGPTGGAMLLFELPQAATENRPLELEISSGDAGAESIAVELDI
jgi:hypothetical protein